jgi:hypothetical protein
VQFIFLYYFHTPGTRFALHHSNSFPNLKMFSLAESCVVVALLAKAAAFLTPEGTVVIPGALSYNGIGLVPQMGWNDCEKSL